MTHANLNDFFDAGAPCEARTGNPLRLLGRDSVWLVSAGKVDVFLAKISNDHLNGALRPLFRVEAGQILCGMPETASAAGWTLVAMGAPGNRLLRVDRAAMQALLQHTPDAARQAAGLLDNWVERLASPLTELPPASATLLALNAEHAPKNEYVAAPGAGLLTARLDEVCEARELRRCRCHRLVHRSEHFARRLEHPDRLPRHRERDVARRIAKRLERRLARIRRTRS